MTYHMAQELSALLEECRSEYVPCGAKTSSEWERRRKKVRQRLSRLSGYIDKAAAMVREPYTTGRRKKHTPGERARLLLFAVMTRRSNRDMESMMELLFPYLRLQGLVQDHRAPLLQRGRRVRSPQRVCPDAEKTKACRDTSPATAPATLSG